MNILKFSKLTSRIASTSKSFAGRQSKSAIRFNEHGRYCIVFFPFVPMVTLTNVVNCSVAGRARKLQYHTATAVDMSNDEKNASSIYEFTVKDTHGKDVSLSKYKGKVVLVVNIASKCNLTKKNYQKLTDLKEKYGERGLIILNFPCNQFNSEMPEADGEPMVCHLRDSKADIGELFAKVNVNGDDAAPLYKYLKAKQTGTLGSGIKWNFTKFLVDKEGIPINRYAPTTDPMDIAKDIEKLL